MTDVEDPKLPPQEETTEPTAGKKRVRKKKAEGEGEATEKTSSVRRSNFSNLYPEDAKITLNVTENPKKEGSKSRARFEHYFGSETVGDYLAKGGTYQDIAYDIGRGFVTIEPVEDKAAA